MLSDKLSVYLVADPDQSDGDILGIVEAALAGGVTAVQLRAKSGTDRERFYLAQNLQELCDEHSALFIVNDRFDIALALTANGVHLGADDLPIFHTRGVAPDGFIIGYSPANADNAKEAGDAETDLSQVGFEGADYLGIGPVFDTRSKPDAGEALGLEAFSRRVKLAGIPCIGIGGIDANNAASVIELGAVGVAVMSSVLRAPDPEKAAWEIASAVREAKTISGRTT